MPKDYNYVRLALQPEDMEHLLELLGDQEDALVYKLKARWLEHQASMIPKPAKRASKRV
jgi:hypothetical protein